MYKLCKICGKKRANKKHVETHGITYDEYLKKYEKEKYNERSAVKKINELYITVRYKHCEMNSKGEYKTYSTINNVGLKRKYALCDNDIKDHLRQKKTLAIFTPKNYSKFIIFDIDKRDIGILEDVYSALSAYIPNKDIHCSFSGNKGYHIAVFFDELVHRETLEKFYKIVLADTGYKPNEVELLGANGRAIKLPIGINFKNKNNGDNYCYFCNQFGVSVGAEISDDIRYLESVKPISPKPIYDAVEVNFGSVSRLNYFTDDELIEIDELGEVFQQAHFKNYSIHNKIDTIEKLIKLGMNQPETRHKSMLHISIYLKDIKKYTKDENREFLKKWITKQDASLYKSNWEEINRDIYDMTNSIYRRDYKLKVKRRSVSLSALDLKEILSVKGKALRRLYFILYVHCKAYSDDKGAFYMTYKQMGQMGAESNNARVKKQIKRLEELKKVEILQEDRYKKPNRYRVLALDKRLNKEIELEKVFFICDNHCENCLEKACSEILTPEEIETRFSYREAKRIRNLKGKCKNPANKRQKSSL